MELAELVEKGGENATSALSKLVLLSNKTTRNSTEFSSLIMLLVETREQLKSASNYQLADYIRDSLSKSGIRISDTFNGPEWTFDA